MVTAFYAGLLGFVFLGLSIYTIRARRDEQIALGHDDSRRILKAMRAHANFAEYTPLCLVLILFLEMQGGASTSIHFFGAFLLIGRSVHAYGLTRRHENFRYRVTGMSLTFIVLLGAAFSNIWLGWAAISGQ